MTASITDSDPRVIDPNLLIVADAILRAGSVGGAAKMLHVTSSAVSNALAKLREATGDRWFARQGRGIVPTPFATSLAPSIRRALAELEAVGQRTAFDPATTTRTFTLAIADVGQVVRVPAIAAKLAREMPHARLRVVGVQSLVSLGGVAGTEVDVAIGVPETVPGVHSKPLFEEPTVLAGRRGRPKGPLRHIAVEMVPGYGDPVEAAYAKAKVARDVALIVPTFITAAAIAASTDYVTTMPESLFLSLADRFGLAVIESAPALTMSMHMWWHERTHADAACVAFRALLEAVTRGPSRRAVSERRRRATDAPGRGLPPAKRRRSVRRRGDRD